MNEIIFCNYGGEAIEMDELLKNKTKHNITTTDMIYDFESKSLSKSLQLLSSLILEKRRLRRRLTI
jgi:hypothetical protein